MITSMDTETKPLLCPKGPMSNTCTLKEFQYTNLWEVHSDKNTMAVRDPIRSPASATRQTKSKQNITKDM